MKIPQPLGLNDTNLKRLMHIAIERQEMKTVYFDEILNVFKENLTCHSSKHHLCEAFKILKL